MSNDVESVKKIVPEENSQDRIALELTFIKYIEKNKHQDSFSYSNEMEEKAILPYIFCETSIILISRYVRAEEHNKKFRKLQAYVLNLLVGKNAQKNNKFSFF
jgi:hypothetical protein